jgi:hypothetical protein
MNTVTAAMCRALTAATMKKPKTSQITTRPMPRAALAPGMAFSTNRPESVSASRRPWAIFSRARASSPLTIRATTYPIR